MRARHFPVVEILESATVLKMSTVNLAECLIITKHRQPNLDLESRILQSGIQFIPPSATHAQLAVRAEFSLNIGDRFAYALAKTEKLKLVTLDSDFKATDIQVVLP
jgi:uncharacterized protein with PIN domain